MFSNGYFVHMVNGESYKDWVERLILKRIIRFSLDWRQKSLKFKVLNVKLQKPVILTYRDKGLGNSKKITIAE